MWRMPERRRLGTGENITRSGLTAHSITRRPKSSAQPATGGELITEQCGVRKLTYGCSRQSPLSGGPKNGEQAKPSVIKNRFAYISWVEQRRSFLDPRPYAGSPSH